MGERIYVFKRFERFWHWSQAVLIIFLLATGLEVHGLYPLLGFGKAAALHTKAAWGLMGLWVFAIFWHLTTGEWKQYIPTLEKIGAMTRYYLSGIFTHAPHPFRSTSLRKHNPLQRLAYLFILIGVSPLIWVTGWLYLFYPDWNAWGLGWLDLRLVAIGHTIGAFLMLTFLAAHIYLATCGHTVLAHFKAMVLGYEEYTD